MIPCEKDKGQKNSCGEKSLLSKFFNFIELKFLMCPERVWSDRIDFVELLLANNDIYWRKLGE